jgi:hypothetical protein
MQLPRFLGIVDLGIIIVVLVALVLPAREMYASAAMKGEPLDHFALSAAEAGTIAHPDDGARVADLARRLGDAGFKDWAIEASVDGSERAKGSASRWRALLAASVAYVDRIDVIPALDYANRAMAACEVARDSGGCPSWEEVRMRLYHQQLDAGVKSGIDPRRDPKGFRRAAEKDQLFIRLKSGDKERGPDKPAPSPSP